MRRLPDKALIYASNACGLLVFHEPDFPDVPMQVPGGTVEFGEAPLEAAKREFVEETGLDIPLTMSHLKRDDHRFLRDGVPHIVLRNYYHALLPDDLPRTWDHIETHAHDGAQNILFRYSWVNIQEADHGLGIGLNAAIPELRAVLHNSAP